MDTLLTDLAIDDLVADFIADAATSLPQSTSSVLTSIARHRLSDEEPDADEVDAVDEDDDDDEEPANIVKRIFAPIAVRS